MKLLDRVRDWWEREPVDLDRDTWKPGPTSWDGPDPDQLDRPWLYNDTDVLNPHQRKVIADMYSKETVNWVESVLRQANRHRP